MDLLVTYDIETATPEGQRRLRKVARACEGIGTRVQKSVFEVVCSDVELIKIMGRLSRLIDPSVDSVRFYVMRSGSFTDATHVGAAVEIDHRSDIII